MINMEIIPEKLIPILSFSPEPISKWTDETDLIKFLCMHDKFAEIITTDGTTLKTSFRD
jgi:hypothetical protein